MNNVQLIGRLTKDPEVRYTGNTQTAVCNFVVAIERYNKDKKETDFPRCTAFGKTAESMEKHSYKGQRIAVEGALRTGTYQNQHGDSIYTTEVMVNRVEFLQWRQQPERSPYDEFAEVQEELPY